VSLEHKEWVLPELDTSGDDGDPDWTPADDAAFGCIFPEGSGELMTLRRRPGAWARRAVSIREEREHAVAAYEAGPDDLAAAWLWLDRHPVFWNFRPGWPRNHVRLITESGGVAAGLDLFPSTAAGRTVIRYEVIVSPDIHAWELDGGGSTWEQVILEAARSIHGTYGNDRTGIPVPAWQPPGGDTGQVSFPVYIDAKIQLAGGNLDEVRAFAGEFFVMTSRCPAIRGADGVIRDLLPGFWVIRYAPRDFGVSSDSALIRYYGKD
jgi:hypothetical protein